MSARSKQLAQEFKAHQESAEAAEKEKLDATRAKNEKLYWMRKL